MKNSDNNEPFTSFLRFLADFIRSHLGIFVGVTLALIYFVFAALLPIVSILTNYEDGETFIKFYSHLYLYPAFFGWLTILLLIYPVKYLYSNKILIQRRFKILFLIILILSVFMLMVDINSTNTAPFEIKANILESNPDLKDHFKTTPFDRNRKKISDEERSRLSDESRKKYDEERKKYDEANEKYYYTALELIENSDNWSTSRFFHYISVFVQILSVFITGFITLILVHSKFTDSVEDSYEFRAAYLCCSSVVLISYLWLLMFVAFEHQKQDYFFEISNQATFYVVLFGFFIVTLLLPIMFVKLIGGDLVNNLIPIILLLGGAGSALFFATNNKDTLVKLFGKNAEINNYWIILLGIIIVFAVPFIFFYKDPKK